MIRALSGDDCGVWQDENHEVVEWTDGQHRVVFSYTRVGNGVSAHFACNPDSLRCVKVAINEFVEWIDWAYLWSAMVVALVDRPSVARVVERCGFHKVCDVDVYEYYARAL